MNALSRCSRHPGAVAGWRCRGCDSLLCPACAFVRVVPPVELVCCCRCGEAAEPITAHRAALRSYAGRLPAALGATFTAGGMLTLAGSALVTWFLGKLGLVGAALAAGVFWGLVFAAVQRATRGEPGVEPPDLSDVFHDLIRPALMGLLAMAIVVVPAALWVFLRPDGWSDSWLRDPVLWLVATASVFYVPVAILSAAMGGGVLQMLNPVTMVAAAVRLGRDYLVAVAACVVLAVAHALALALGAALPSIPVVSGVVAQFLGLLAPVMMARALGLLLHVRGDAIGMGMPGEYLEPVLPGAVPRGTPPAAPRGAEQAPAERGTAARIEAIELDRQPPAPAPPDEAASIADDVARGDLASAAQRFARLRAPPTTVAAAVLFQVARGAAAAGEHLLAARALHAAAQSNDPAIAPDALLVLGRICLQRLNRPADARAALEWLLSRFPESGAARHGRELLARVPVA